MTLFKQIAPILSTFLIIILTIFFMLNFQSVSSSLQNRLDKEAKKTALSLGASISRTNGDKSVIQTMINACFDTNYYQYISLTDIEKNIIYKRVLDKKTIDVPQWFINTFTLRARVASVNVISNLPKVGVINVKGDTGYAYIELYNLFKNLLISFSIITFIALIILNIFLVLILRPLKKIQYQAEAIAHNEFVFNKSIPYTEEFKDVVLAMNVMVKKIKAMFDKGNEELKKQRELEYIDETTKLKNRKYFLDKLPEYLKEDATSNSGVNMIVAISGIIEANKEIGYIEVNNLFIKMAKIFNLHTNTIKDSIVARMNGSEFCIFLPECSDQKALEIAENILYDVGLAIGDTSLDNNITFISIGLYGYSHNESISKLLLSSDKALTKAKINEKNIYQKSLDINNKQKNIDKLEYIINNAISNSKFYFISFKAVDTKLKKVLHNRLSLSLLGDDNTIYKYSQFMPIANQLGLSNQIYNNIFKMIFKTPDETLNDSTCSIRLPFDYLVLDGTYDYMKETLKRYKNNLQFKLIIEIPDKFAYKYFIKANLYKELLQKYEIDIGIYEFIGESDDFEYIKDLRPIYIKGDARYFLSLNDKTLSAIKMISDSVNISLIATDVKDKKILEELEAKDLYLIQGSVTNLL